MMVLVYIFYVDLSFSMFLVDLPKSDISDFCFSYLRLMSNDGFYNCKIKCFFFMYYVPKVYLLYL